MDLGLFTFGSRLATIVSDAVRAEDEGFAMFTMANIAGHDAIGAMTVAGTRTSRIRLATGVVPPFPRHPTAMAQQALTAQAASGGRFTLGIGLSHKVTIEGGYGLSFDRPAVHMREYLSVLMPLLHLEPVQFDGERYHVRATLRTHDTTPVRCLIAAMAPVMLNLAGSMADGTILWMTGGRAVGEHIVPRITRAAAAAGRPAPEVVCMLPIALTSDPVEARAKAAGQFENYGRLPSYRAMLDKEGVEGPGDVAIVGDEATLRAELGHLRDAGATTFVGGLFDAGDGSAERTRAFLASVLGEYR